MATCSEKSPWETAGKSQSRGDSGLLLTWPLISANRSWNLNRIIPSRTGFIELGKDSLLPCVSCTQVAKPGNPIWVVLPPKFHIHPIFSISATVALVKVLMSFLELSLIEPISRRAAWADPSRPESSQFRSGFLYQDEIPPGHCFSSAASWFPILCLKFIFHKCQMSVGSLASPSPGTLLESQDLLWTHWTATRRFASFPRCFVCTLKCRKCYLEHAGRAHSVQGS